MTILIFSSIRKREKIVETIKNKQCTELFFFGTYLVLVTNPNRYLILHLSISTPRKSNTRLPFDKVLKKNSDSVFSSLKLRFPKVKTFSKNPKIKKIFLGGLRPPPPPPFAPNPHLKEHSGEWTHA
jgi:hypothetical protein